MSSTSIIEEPKTNEESLRERRSLRDLLVDQVRRLIPSRCNITSAEESTSSENSSQRNVPKPDVPRCSTQASDPNVTVLHVRASIQRTNASAYHRPPDFSEQDSELEITISPPPGPPKVVYGPPPLAGAPPSYSAVMRLGNFDHPRPPSIIRRREVPIQPSPPFIAPAPPPSYAEAEGFLVEAAVSSVEQMGFGAQPTVAVCPNCGIFVLTTIQRRSSNLAHFSAFVLCICGCWPCCLIPYCIDACKIIQHHCSACNQLLGVYRPYM